MTDDAAKRPRSVNPMIELSEEDLHRKSAIGPGVMYRVGMTPEEIRRSYGEAPHLERKLALDREKNRLMRSMLDVMQSADTVHGERG